MSKHNQNITLQATYPKWLSSYVTVGDLINGKPVTEIWSTSTGTVMYVVDGEDFDFEGLKKELLKQAEEEEQQDDDYWEGVMAEDQYETMRQIAMDNGEL
jgi:hypothetical protein